MDALPQTGDIKIHYHTGFLTYDQNMAVAGLAGIALLILALGSLAPLQSLGVLSHQLGTSLHKVSWACLAGGCGLLLIDAIILIAMGIKHKRIDSTLRKNIPELSNVIIPPGSYYRENTRSRYPDNTYVIRVTLRDGTQETHQFPDDRGCIMYWMELEANHYQKIPISFN